MVIHTESEKKMATENLKKALYLIGCQGGTVHQMSRLTGLSTEQIHSSKDIERLILSRFIGKQLKTRHAFKWYRNFSAFPEPIEVEADAPVIFYPSHRCFYVNTSYFGHPSHNILAHDAKYYGCRVDPENVYIV